MQLVFSKTKKYSGEVNNQVALPLVQFVKIYSNNNIINSINQINKNTQLGCSSCNKK